jgi:hypothetical protein
MVIVIPTLLAGFTAGTIAQDIEEGSGYPLGIVGKLIWYVFFVWGIGFYLALMVHRFFPRAAKEGRWVWVVPMSFFLLAFIRDALMSSLPHVLTEFFYPGPNGESGWALMLITYPTCAAILYSLGMFYASRRRRRRDIARLPTPVEN